MKVNEWIAILEEYPQNMEVMIDTRGILHRKYGFRDTIANVHNRSPSNPSLEEAVIISLGRSDGMQILPRPLPEEEVLAKKQDALNVKILAEQQKQKALNKQISDAVEIALAKERKPK